MQKCGMVYEGTLRQAGKCNYGIFDVVCYSMLASEYKNKAAD
jgi:ribosomal-protein-alanine N-acetyltransferase